MEEQRTGAATASMFSSWRRGPRRRLVCGEWEGDAEGGGGGGLVDE